MELDEYQRRAAETNQLPAAGPQNAVAPMLGLASEAGAILNVYKAYLRNKIDLPSNRNYLQEELGDLLWYVASIATAFDLSLSQVAEENLARTHDYFLPADLVALKLQELPRPDSSFPPTEQFPRKMVFDFRETVGTFGEPLAHIRIINAVPHQFGDGQIFSDEKPIGFQIGDSLGAQLDDNSRRADAYRYHDAIHMGFAAVLGWSPVIRNLLHLKRRSDPAVDHGEDGARAIFAEEGLVAMLAQLSVRRLSFQTETSVDMETIGVAKAVVTDLESGPTPAWLWRRAISQAFVTYHQLRKNRGGIVTADLDARTLTFETRK